MGLSAGETQDVGVRTAVLLSFLAAHARLRGHRSAGNPRGRVEAGPALLCRLPFLLINVGFDSFRVSQYVLHFVVRSLGGQAQYFGRKRWRVPVHSGFQQFLK